MPNSLPSVSVIMPVRNEESFIDRSLGAMLAQDYPADRLEILVIDGMSTDRTRDRVADLAAASPVTVRLLDNPNRIVPFAMNIGIQAATGDLILRMDGHTLAPPNYISLCVQTLLTTGADNVGGVVEYEGSDAFSRAAGLAAQSKFGCGGAPARSAREGHVDTVSFGCWRREAFARFGMFDEAFVRTQDSEFNYRTRLLGGTVWMNPGIRTQYFNRATPWKLARQYYQYGFWKTRLMFKLRRLSRQIAHENHETSRNERGLTHGRHGKTRKADVSSSTKNQEPRTKNPAPTTNNEQRTTNNEQPTIPADRLHWRHLAPPALVVSLLVSLLIVGCSSFIDVGAPGWVAGLAIPVVYATGCAMASMYLAAKKQAWRYAPLFLVTFPVLHISWGTGFIVGLIRKPRWTVEVV